MSFDYCKYFVRSLANKWTNILKRDDQQSINLYPILAGNGERRNLTNREILQKYIDLDTWCLNQKEKKELMDMLYNYKEASSLRGENGMCHNIKLEIDVIHKPAFFIRLYNVKENKNR